MRKIHIPPLAQFGFLIIFYLIFMSAIHDYVLTYQTLENMVYSMMVMVTLLTMLVIAYFITLIKKEEGE